MRVLSIEIHGFKSFAQSVRLEFDAGIAGVVGPNGSGKSNLVEAVRWVLGEQSLSQLRSKRTEDVIWAGTKGRAPSGMAEVSITFDNSDRALPIGYSEVTITRRAYRSGENEYMINRSRVRLRDVTELVSALGQGYTVVSQGTADAALSLTPEGRRGLFEEAADITQHYARRDEALRRLGEMDANSARVADVLAELRPRLRTLARQARQARDREAEEARLRDLLLAYFSRELARSEQALACAQGKLDGAEGRARQLRAAVGEASAREQDLKRAQDRLARDVANLDLERAELASEEQAAARALIAADGRASGLERELRDASTRLASAVQARDAAGQEHDEAGRALEEARGEVERAASRVRRHEEEQSGYSAGQEAALRAVEELREEVFRCETATTRTRNRAAALREKLDAVDKEHADRASEVSALEERLRRAEREAAELEEALEAKAARRAEHSASLEAIRAHARALSAEVAALFSDATEMDVSLREQRARLRLLEELRDTGAGLNRGAQAIIKAAAAGRLYGVLGTLGSLLEAPERYEQAIEAVLGAALQNVVTETWQDAEEGIALLKRSGAGRATFLPLDTLRPPNRPSPPAGAGIIGLAADLVNCPDHARPAVQHALGRVLVVEDLPAARSLVSRMGGLGAVVTLAGDTLRPGGALTGGTGVRESGVLARSRELRELPSRIESAERERRDVEDRLREARQRSEEAAALERSRSAEREAADKEMRAAQGLADDARRRLERAAQEQEWLQATVRKLEAEREALRSAVDRAEEEVRTAEAEASEAARRLRVATEAAGALEREARDAASQLAALRTELAVAGERLRASQAAERRAQGSLDRARSAAATARSAEQECTQRAREALEAAALARSRHDELVRRLRALDDRLTPLRASLHRAGLDLEAARSEASRLATEALGAEEERLAAALELERARDAHASLLARAARETCQAEIPRGLLPPDDVERLIQAGTDRLARIGPVNALAAREHEELQARAEFLERQLEDVQSAQVDLRRLIASLEEQMERRFSDTFREVSERFGAHFRRLFGGGAAELALVTKGDSVGVEIRAQPPGKRLGSLSLLSGGERALTSCALLFALIQAGGAPFCVLDEVDAALDESNVGRFCDLLEDLARETQFIVVTHNRGTIERASTLYGVSMEASGVSKVLSLRLESEAEERASA